MTWQLNRFVIPPVFAVYPTVQTNAILLYYNALTFVCYIPLLVALIVFYRFTGLAFSDIHGLRKEHIVEDSNGVRGIRKGRQKTKIMCNIPLMEVPLKILEKYSTNEYCRKHGVLFPVLCNQKMNACLKELADICGIKKTLTTHVARHTFATFALANGVSIESVAKMLGHTNVQMTRHYARVLDRTVIREMSQIKMDFHFSM
jgi:site-specific recombinase XerD